MYAIILQYLILQNYLIIKLLNEVRNELKYKLNFVSLLSRYAAPFYLRIDGCLEGYVISRESDTRVSPYSANIPWKFLKWEI